MTDPLPDKIRTRIALVGVAAGVITVILAVLVRG
jgi:hypothetical protein